MNDLACKGPNRFVFAFVANCRHYVRRGTVLLIVPRRCHDSTNYVRGDVLVGEYDFSESSRCTELELHA